MKPTFGDFRLWATAVLHKELTKIINFKQNRQRPYYILVIIKKGYFGPPANSPNKTVDKNFEGKIVFTTRYAILERPPVVPMFSSGLFRVDNRIGEVKCLYMLPPDAPMIETGNEEDGSELVFKSAKRFRMPLIFSKN